MALKYYSVFCCCSSCSIRFAKFIAFALSWIASFLFWAVCICFLCTSDKPAKCSLYFPASLISKYPLLRYSAIDLEFLAIGVIVNMPFSFSSFAIASSISSMTFTIAPLIVVLGFFVSSIFGRHKVF